MYSYFQVWLFKTVTAGYPIFYAIFLHLILLCQSHMYNCFIIFFKKIIVNAIYDKLILKLGRCSTIMV